MRYDAFVLYNQTADGRLAESVVKELQRFAKPWYKQRALRIFRDSSDLSASPRLWENIEKGLAESEYLLVMAAPNSAASKWCQKEISYWIDNKPLDNLLILLTEGELVWDDATRDFNWEKTTALSAESCKGIFEGEPFFVDLRDDKQRESYEMANGSFRDHIVLIAATLHKKSVGDMVGEEIQQHRRTIRIRNVAIAVLSILLLSVAGLGVYAEINRREAVTLKGIAEDEANRANREKIRSEKQTVVAQTNSSNAYLNSGLQLDALLAAVKACKKLKEIPELSEKDLSWYEAVIALHRAVYDTRELNRLETGHTRGVDVNFSPDGETILTVGGDGIIRRWSLRGEEMDSFETGHHGKGDGCSAIHSFGFSPEGRNLVTVGNEGRVKFWNRNDQPLREGFNLRVEGDGYCTSINGVRIDFKNKSLAIIDTDGNLSRWNFEGKMTGTLGKLLQNWSPYVFSSDGRLAATNKDGMIIVWGVGGKVLHRLKAGDVSTIEFSHDGQSLWFATREGLVKQVELNGIEIRSFESGQKAQRDGSNAVQSLVLTGDDSLVATGGADDTLKLWSRESRSPIVLQTHHGGSVSCISFSPDGSQVATASSDSPDSIVKIWDVPGEQPLTLDSSDEEITAVDFSPDGKMIATAGKGQITLVNLATAKEKTISTGSGKIYCLAFSHDGKIIGVGKFPDVEVWRCENGARILRVKHDELVQHVRFSQDDRNITAVSRRGTVATWSIDGEELEPNRSPWLSDLNSMPIVDGRLLATTGFISPDGKFIAAVTGRYNESLEIRDGTGNRLASFNTNQHASADFVSAITDFTISPDSQMIVTAGSDGTVKFWSDKGELILKLNAHRSYATAKFDPEGKILVTSSISDDRVKLWSRNGRQLASLDGGEHVTGAWFNSDGNKVITIGWEKVCVWNFDLDDLLRRGSRKLRDYLSNNPKMKEDQDLCNEIDGLVGRPRGS